MNNTIDNLTAAFVHLPGIGSKSAQRIAFYILKNPELGQKLIDCLSTALKNIHLCPICFNLADNEVCSICADQNRNRSLICIVEDPEDALTIEQTGYYHGTYHILWGVISPIDNIAPENLRIKELIERIEREQIGEVIIATNPTVEGEASAVYIARLLKPLGVRITRIARGLPVGSDLKIADRETISRAFEGRLEV